MLHQAIYDELKRVAQRQETTTYSAIAPLAGLDMDNPADRDAIRQILTAISTHEHQHGRPMLTAIVVHRQDNIPGHGFFELAQRLGLMRSAPDKVAFFCNEVARVHEEWRAPRYVEGRGDPRWPRSLLVNGPAVDRRVVASATSATGTTWP